MITYLLAICLFIKLYIPACWRWGRPCHTHKSWWGHCIYISSGICSEYSEFKKENKGWLIIYYETFKWWKFAK